MNEDTDLKVFILASDRLTVEFRPHGNGEFVTVRTRKPQTGRWQSIVIPAAKARTEYRKLLTLGYTAW